MNTWTVSRRIIAGFIARLVLLIALGWFALWRGQALNEVITELGDECLPGVLILWECTGATRDNNPHRPAVCGRGVRVGAQGPGGAHRGEPGQDR